MYNVDNNFNELKRKSVDAEKTPMHTWVNKYIGQFLKIILTWPIVYVLKLLIKKVDLGTLECQPCTLGVASKEKEVIFTTKSPKVNITKKLMVNAA